MRDITEIEYQLGRQDIDIFDDLVGEDGFVERDRFFKAMGEVNRDIAEQAARDDWSL